MSSAGNVPEASTVWNGGATPARKGTAPESLVLTNKIAGVPILGVRNVVALIGLLALFLSSPPSVARADDGGLKAPGSAMVVPSLREVIALSRSVAPEVVTGETAVLIAQSGIVGARRSPLGNPYLEVVGERGTSGTWGNTSVIGTLWLPLEIGGQRSGRIAEVNASVELYRQNLELMRHLAAAEATRAYGMAVVGRERAHLLEELVEFARSEAALYEGRYRGGDATLRDTRLAAVELGRYGVLLSEAKADIVAALSELGRLTNVAYTAPPNGGLHPPPLDVTAGDADDAPGLKVTRAEARYFERTKERLRREGSSGAFSAMAVGGRGEFGEGRVGAGVAYAFPVLQRNQGEQARAEAERTRALTEEKLKRRLYRMRIAGLVEELAQVRNAVEQLDEDAEPAAVATLEASTEMQRAGKSDLFAILTSRRDLALLRFRRIELAAREWNIQSELVAITGRTP
ncbi:MAG TPA: TolC family protein [Polyangiaceae bacterium]